MRADSIWAQTGIVFERRLPRCSATTRWYYSESYGLLYVVYEMIDPSPNPPPEFLVARCPSTFELQLLLAQLAERHRSVSSLADACLESWEAAAEAHFTEAGRDWSPWRVLSGEVLYLNYLIDDEDLAQRLPSPSPDLSDQHLFDIIMAHCGDY